MISKIDFERLFNCSPNPYMLLDRSFRFVAANDAYLAVTGSRRESILGRNLFEAFPGNPDDPNDQNVRQLRASLERVLARREHDELALIPYVIARETPEGVVYEERFWSATHTPLLDDDGEVAYILQHTVDVTELQNIKQALRDAETALDARATRAQIEEGVFRRAQVLQEVNRTLDVERRRLLSLFRQAPGFVAVLGGPEHTFELANDAYNQLVGNREVVGKSVREALPEVINQGFVSLLDRVYATGEAFVGEGMSVFIQRTPHAPLEERYLDFIYQPVSEPDGTVSGIFVQGHDVTEQIRAQQALRELNDSLEQRVAQRTAELEIRNRELQEFAYVASHDLQEPLRKIRAFADLLLREKSAQLDGEGRHYAQRMQVAATRMSTLIKDLLTFSRITRRGQPFAPVDVDHILEAVRSDLNLRIRETGGCIESEPLGKMEADPAQLHQVLLNLVGNALKFHRPGVPPVVRVSREDTGNGVRLVVSDNGIGFDEKYLDRIFSPFQRLHSLSAYEGTGMGLAIVRRIAERHGGTVEAHSTPGEGSTFTVTFPRCPRLD